jgi:hypothetical protein
MGIKRSSDQCRFLKSEVENLLPRPATPVNESGYSPKNDLINVNRNELPHELVIRNEQINNAKEEAVRIAIQLWEKDVDKKIRITMMSDQVYKRLSEEYAKVLPETLASLNKWIRHIAPPYAKVGGRPKKNNPPTSD